ncbi:hypothetical protein NE857_33935 (plasmid) [Nocardiopsis exhalans]|uniref:TrbL/VirB6 plasmid conjugal transfer protein n=1 Tax=Nocardiopsis exhalans TaxID=163604 RepID=A0ABY5DHT4_9ACTN|nr:hypothetical protein [Nocardiopsis exhalans]USY23535.1 hypothetical protein NE857_33935 [Nocardiopsis exhalans]
MAGLLLVPSSASALSWCEEKLAPEPKVTGQGVDSVLNDQDVIDRGDVKGLYENYLMSGTTWFVIVDSKDCFDEQRTQGWPFLYNILWGAARGIDMAAIEALRFAVDTPMDALEEVVVDVVEQMRDAIWRPLLPAMTILGAVTLAWWGMVRKRATLTFEGAIWMIAATTLGLWVLMAPGAFMKLVNTVVTTGDEVMSAAVTNVTGDGTDGRCIPGSPEITRAVNEDYTEFVARQQSEYVWESLVCRTWLVGTFGSGPSAEALAGDHARDLIAAQALTRTESMSVGLNTDEDGTDEYYDTLASEKKADFQTISGEIEDAHTPTWNMFRGAEGGDRTMAALVGLVAALTGGLLILAAAVGLLICKLGVILLMLTSPLFFLMGIHPGRGRTVLLRWWELLVGLVIKQWMWMAMVLLLVLTLNTIISTVRPYGLALVLMVALVAAVLKFKDPLWGTLTHVSFSGDNAPSQGGGYSMTKDRMQRAAIGAVKGAVKAPWAVGAGAATGAFRAAVSNPAKREVAARRAVNHQNRVEEIRADDAQALERGQQRNRERAGQVAGAPDGGAGSGAGAGGGAGQNAPDRRQGRVPREWVRQGGGASRPTARRNRTSPRRSAQAPSRQQPTYLEVLRGQAGHGVGGNRQPDQAPRKRPAPAAPATPKRIPRNLRRSTRAQQRRRGTGGGA